MSTLCGAERMQYSSGKAKGTDVIHVFNGKLDFYITVDRAMDIFRLSYCGTNISYISKNGLVNPHLAGSSSYPFLSSFEGGFLYTCGLDNIGAASENFGKDCVQHGSLSSIPADGINIQTFWQGDEYFIEVSGKMSYSALFGSKLSLSRTIRVKYLGNQVEVIDQVANEGFAKDSYLIMYHTNIGYPLLNENAWLTLDSNICDGIGKVDTQKCRQFLEPHPGIAEECFMHTLNPGTGIKASINNGNLRLDLIFDATQQPFLLEWKSMASGDYVLGLEPVVTKMPAKNYISLQPGESRRHGVTYRFSNM